jgi:hypothetical protein
MTVNHIAGSELERGNVTGKNSVESTSQELNESKKE